MEAQSNTPQILRKELYSLINMDINDPIFQPDVAGHIMEICKKHTCPHTVIDSNLRRKDRYRKYIKFNCYFHTSRRNQCSAGFTIYICGSTITEIKFNLMHNHSLDYLFVSSTCNLIDNETRSAVLNDIAAGLNPGFIRRKFNLDLTPQQLYNMTRYAKRNISSADISNLLATVDKWKNNCDIILKKMMVFSLELL